MAHSLFIRFREELHLISVGTGRSTSRSVSPKKTAGAAKMMRERELGQVPPAKIDGKQERNSRHSKKQRNSAASTTSTTSNSTTTLRQQQQTTTTTATSRTNRQKSNRTDQSPTKARKAKKEAAAAEMNPLPKMPPIGAKKKADAVVQPLAQPKPDVVQVADETEAPAAIDVKNQDEKEGNETNEVSHDDEGIAAEEEPDEDFEFGDQTEAELAAISQ